MEEMNVCPARPEEEDVRKMEQDMRLGVKPACWLEDDAFMKGKLGRTATIVEENTRMPSGWKNKKVLYGNIVF